MVSLQVNAPPDFFNKYSCAAVTVFSAPERLKDGRSLLRIYWGEARFCYSLDTDHKVHCFPAVILSSDFFFFFKVRPHVKPSHP